MNNNKQQSSSIHLVLLQNKQPYRASKIPAQSLRLPYLKPAKPMSYHIQSPEQSRSRRDFSLLTSNVKLPIYDATQDKNLSYFFGKASNKSIIEKLQEQEKKKKQKASKTARRHSVTKDNQIVNQISKKQFQNYLNGMKAKIKDSKQTNL